MAIFTYVPRQMYCQKSEIDGSLEETGSWRDCTVDEKRELEKAAHLNVDGAEPALSVFFSANDPLPLVSVTIVKQQRWEGG